MSEYQYYEFQAVDRPLTDKEMRRLRLYSTRARITPTRFVNHYEWGNFKGDEDAWMETYFDAFLYLANWGTRVLQMRFPSKWLPLTTARPYCPGGAASVRARTGRVIVTFVSDDEEAEDWVEGEGWLGSILPVRAEIARGDLRALYLGWLLCVQGGELDDDAVEPAVPPDLGRPSASLRGLVEFLRVDEQLLAAACEASANAEEASLSRDVLAAWVAALPSREKDRMLACLMKGEGAHLGRQLAARFERERRRDGPCDADGHGRGRRTVADLIRAAEQQREIAARKAAEAKARQERKAMVARGKYLEGLAGREATLWARVERFIAMKQPKAYAQALELLVDLRDLAARKGGGDFRARLESLRAAHARKGTLINNLDEAGL